jgi:hypothetical protein
MTDTTQSPLDPLVDAIARRVVELLRGPTAPSDDLLTVEQIQAEYGMGRAALDARGVPRARVGRAYRWRRSAVEASIQAQPAVPRVRRATPRENEDPIDAMVRAGELRATRGTR